MRVLLIEDHKPLARAVKRGLEEHGFAVHTASDSTTGDQLARTDTHDAIVLDLTLTTRDGPALLQQWRRDGIGTHVLVLTARATLQDKVSALDMGADDCLTKPFELEELRARLGALLRRGSHVSPEAVLRVHDLEIHRADHTVKRAGQSITVTPREFAVLELLASHAGKVVTRSMIWEHLYDEHDERSSNVVDVYIRYLRKKLDEGAALPLILTRWGEGYMLRAE